MKTREELHESALALLSLIKEANKKVYAMMQYNVEIAEPNGFTPHDDESIDFQKLVVQRLENSYLKVLHQIIENESIN
jgi:hypothetical protein